MSSKSSSFGLTQFILIKESKFVVFNEDLRNVQRSFIKLNERSTTAVLCGISVASPYRSFTLLKHALSPGSVFSSLYTSTTDLTPLFLKIIINIIYQQLSII